MPRPNLYVGDHHREIGEHETALAAYQRALAKDPRSRTIYVGMATVQDALDAHWVAAKTRRAGLAISPDDVDLHWARAANLWIGADPDHGGLIAAEGGMREG